MTDGFFSRPSLAQVLLGRLVPDQPRIAQALDRAGVDRLDAVLPVHALRPRVGLRRRCRSNWRHPGGWDVDGFRRESGHGLAAERIHRVTPGRPLRFGTFEVTHVPSAHCPPDRYPGSITEPVVPPTRTSSYHRCGEAWSILVTHDSGRTALVGQRRLQAEGSLKADADVAYLGVGQLGVQGRDYIRNYWQETVRAVGARRVVLTHWDDFFRPLAKPLRALPYLGDDLDVTSRFSPNWPTATM